MIKLPLKHPIVLSEKASITELSFRPYTTAADYLSFDQRGGVAQRIALISSLTSTDESLILRLRGPDYRAAEAIADKLLNEDEEVQVADTPATKTDAELALEKK